MRYFLKGLFFIVFFGMMTSFIVTPFVVHGAGIVECGNSDSAECTLCDLQKTATNVVEFIITLATVMATLLFVNAGILYVLSPANPGNIAKAHRLFTNTLIGFILILSSWLIVSLIMSTLYNSSFGTWNNVFCSGGSTGGNVAGTEGDTPEGGTTGGTADSGATGDGATGGTGGVSVVPPASGTLSEAEARDALADNVTISPLVTSLDGSQATTINGLNSMADASGVPKDGIVMTSGTDLPGAHSETGTYSHINGYKVDIDDNNAAFNNYITSNFTQTGVREGAYGGPIYTGTINGKKVEAVKESRAWDITFFPS